MRHRGFRFLPSCVGLCAGLFATGALATLASSARADVLCGSTSAGWNVPDGDAVFEESPGVIESVLAAVGEYRSHSMLSRGPDGWVTHATSITPPVNSDRNPLGSECSAPISQNFLYASTPGLETVSQGAIYTFLYKGGPINFIGYQSGQAQTPGGSNPTIGNLFVGTGMSWVDWYATGDSSQVVFAEAYNGTQIHYGWYQYMNVQGTAQGVPGRTRASSARRRWRSGNTTLWARRPGTPATSCRARIRVTSSTPPRRRSTTASTASARSRRAACSRRSARSCRPSGRARCVLAATSATSPQIRWSTASPTTIAGRAAPASGRGSPRRARPSRSARRHCLLEQPEQRQRRALHGQRVERLGLGRERNGAVEQRGQQLLLLELRSPSATDGRSLFSRWTRIALADFDCVVAFSGERHANEPVTSNADPRSAGAGCRLSEPVCGRRAHAGAPSPSSPNPGARRPGPHPRRRPDAPSPLPARRPSPLRRHPRPRRSSTRSPSRSPRCARAKRTSSRCERTRSTQPMSFSTTWSTARWVRRSR